MADESKNPPAERAHAVALRYGANDSAPVVVAKGAGHLAEQIIAKARASGVAVHESKELAQFLMRIDLEEQIPPQLYRAVAEILIWLGQAEAAKATLTRN